MTLLQEMGRCENLTAVSVYGDGNCLARCGSLIMYGDEKHHLDVRLRIVCELALNVDTYLDSIFLARGYSSTKGENLHVQYAMFSDHYTPNTTLCDADVRTIFEKEVMSIVRPGSFMGMWQVHALASVIGTPIQSVYPGTGSVQNELNRPVVPREGTLEQNTICYIMWTTTDKNTSLATWFQPNHFVPLLPKTLPSFQTPEVGTLTNQSDDLKRE